ncbi:murein biosynthesis integral membrane protein MurJ [soil metagenome]
MEDSDKTALPSLRGVAGMVVVAGVLSRVVGVLREVLIARHFGVSAELDAVYLGIAAPMSVAFGVGSGMVRAGVAAAAGMEPARMAALMRYGARRMLLWMVPGSLILAATAPVWAHWMGAHEGPAAASVLVTSAIFTSLMLSASGLAGFYAGLINARGSHFAPAMTPLVYNVIVCAAIAILHARLGALSVLAGIVAAEIFQVVIYRPVLGTLLPARGEAMLPPPRAEWAALTAVFAPALLSAMLLNGNTAIDRFFAGRLQEGSIAALAYADKLVNLPAGLLGMALAVPMATRLGRYRAAGEEGAFARTLLLGVRVLLLAGLPAVALLATTARPAVGLLLERGAFQATGVDLCARALSGYAFAIPFVAIAPLLIGAGLTHRKPWLVVWIMIATSVENALLDWVLAAKFGIIGITISTTAVALTRVALMLHLASPGIWRERGLWGTLARASVFTALLGAALWFVRNGNAEFFESPKFVERVVALAIAGGVGAVVTAVLWFPLLRREWKSLEVLRGEVAEYARKKEEG